MQGYGYHMLKEVKAHARDDMDGINYQIKLAKLLIEHGANLDAKNLKNETPLATAMRNKNHSLVAVLIKAGSKFWLDSDEEGNTFLHYYATLAARTNSVRAHGFEENVVRRQRFEKAIQDIWQAAQNVIKKKGIDFEAIVSISFSLVPNTFFFSLPTHTHTHTLLFADQQAKPQGLQLPCLGCSSCCCM